MCGLLILADSCRPLSKRKQRGEAVSISCLWQQISPFVFGLLLSLHPLALTPGRSEWGQRMKGKKAGSDGVMLRLAVDQPALARKSNYGLSPTGNT